MVVLARTQERHIEANLSTEGRRQECVDQRVDASRYLGKHGEHGRRVGIDELIDTQLSENGHQRVRSPCGTEKGAHHQRSPSGANFCATEIPGDVVALVRFENGGRLAARRIVTQRIRSMEVVHVELFRLQRGIIVFDGVIRQSTATLE